MTARDLLTGYYFAFVIVGGVYLFSAVLLLAETRKQEKRKREGKR